MTSDNAFSSRMEDSSGTTMMMRASAGLTADPDSLADTGATMCAAYAAAASPDPIRTATI